MFYIIRENKLVEVTIERYFKNDDLYKVISKKAETLTPNSVYPDKALVNKSELFIKADLIDAANYEFNRLENSNI